MTMDQHTKLAGQFAVHFGNAEFEGLEPRELMIYVVSHHDAGWRELDAAVQRDPSTGLPYHLVQTPLDWIIKTSSASPDFNGKHHAFCELISSMHSWGLYNGRYGMSDKVLLDNIAGEHRDAVEAMLAHEKARQDKLIEQLSSHSATAEWVASDKLFQSYKQLQFFDTLALYFNCSSPQQRTATTFEHVPINCAQDTRISITPLADDCYRLSPFPFNENNLMCEFSGRLLVPAPDQETLTRQFNSVELREQRITLSA